MSSLRKKQSHHSAHDSDSQRDEHSASGGGLGAQRLLGNQEMVQRLQTRDAPGFGGPGCGPLAEAATTLVDSFGWGSDVSRVDALADLRAKIATLQASSVLPDESVQQDLKACGGILWSNRAMTDGIDGEVLALRQSIKSLRDTWKSGRAASLPVWAYTWDSDQTTTSTTSVVHTEYEPRDIVYYQRLPTIGGTFTKLGDLINRGLPAVGSLALDVEFEGKLGACGYWTIDLGGEVKKTQAGTELSVSARFAAGLGMDTPVAHAFAGVVVNVGLKFKGDSVDECIDMMQLALSEMARTADEEHYDAAGKKIKVSPEDEDKGVRDQIADLICGGEERARILTAMDPISSGDEADGYSGFLGLGVEGGFGWGSREDSKAKIKLESGGRAQWSTGKGDNGLERSFSSKSYMSGEFSFEGGAAKIAIETAGVESDISLKFEAEIGSGKNAGELLMQAITGIKNFCASNKIVLGMLERKAPNLTVGVDKNTFENSPKCAIEMSYNTKTGEIDVSISTTQKLSEWKPLGGEVTLEVGTVLYEKTF
jgi:hypothetical protein